VCEIDICKKLAKLGLDMEPYKNECSNFMKKLNFLRKTGKYTRLLSKFYKDNDLSNLISAIFELHFAYMFESNGEKLEYEVNLLRNTNSKVDFVYKSENLQLNMELLYIREQDWIRKEQEKPIFSICLKNDDTDSTKTEKEALIRIQKLILRKCIDKDNHPIKFPKPTTEQMNIIVVNVSKPLLEMLDENDYIELVLGFQFVKPPFISHGIFGLASPLPYDDNKNYYKKFQFFRERIHGVIFAKDRNESNIYIDSKYEFFFVPNCYLMNDKFLYRKFISCLPFRLQLLK